MGMTPQEAAAAGLGWVDENHPLYGTAGFVGSQPAGGAAPAPGAAPAGGGTAGAGGTPTPQDAIAAQAGKAQTYSSTPGAAPTANTANQGTQDVVRNSWLDQATQSTTVDPNDPNLKQQTDSFAAGQERMRRNYEADAAERLSAQGLGNSGAMDNERRYAQERAGQATGAFQAQLVGQELKFKRDQIADALNHLGDTISNDQKNALTKQLADLDATIKQQGIASGEKVGMAEIGVKDKLGTASNSNDLMRLLLQNQQFNDGQALDWSKFDWTTNPMNPQNY